MSTFWKRVLEVKPDLEFVYFSPSKQANLRCRVHSDGTISPAMLPDTRFGSAKALADAWKTGSVTTEEGQKLAPRTKTTSLLFQRDCFLQPGRKERVQNLLPPDRSKSKSERCRSDEPPASRGQLDESISQNQVDESTSQNQMDESTSQNQMDESTSQNQMDESTSQNQMDESTSPGQLEEPTSQSQLDALIIQSAVVESPSQHQMDETTSQSQMDEPTKQNKVEKSIIQRQKKPCPGFSRLPYEQAIKERRWDGARAQFSPVAWDKDQCWSRKCEKEMAACQKLCYECKKAEKVLRVIRRRYNIAPVTEERRITSSSNAWLTKDDLRKKVGFILNSKRKAVAEARKMDRRAKTLEKEVGKYRPEDKKHRQAVRSIVRKLDEINEKLRNPVCLWNPGDGLCGHWAISVNLLSRHVKETHLIPRVNENSSVQPLQRKYSCEWRGCRRRVDFDKFEQLRKHVITHTGNSKTEMEASMLVEQMINSVKAPSARRYCDATRRVVLGKHKSQQTLKRVKAMNPLLPLPSLRSVLGWKNTGDVNSGVDEEVLKLMAKLARDHVELRHGILSFDEVHVSPYLSVQQKSQLVFGHADNDPHELATTAMVFQYVSLFTKKRFAVNVAFYGCFGLNAYQLKLWLWDVMIGLQRYGFRVHALICDGGAVNRSLQDLLVSEAKKYGQTSCERYVIDHPLTAAPDIKLFILSDPSHAIKKLRNCWFNRDMEYVGDGYRCPIKWDHLREVQRWQEKQQRVDRRLMAKHLDITHFEKMSVMTAVDVMSEAIADAMCGIDPADLGMATLGTRDFMCMGRELWLCMNNHRTYYNETEAARILCGLEYVSDNLRRWEAGTEDEPDKFLTWQTNDDVRLISDGVPVFMRYVWNVLSKYVPNAGYKPKVLSQDPLERTFGSLRQRRGGTQHMTMMELAFNLRTINCNVLNNSVVV